MKFHWNCYSDFESFEHSVAPRRYDKTIITQIKIILPCIHGI